MMHKRPTLEKYDPSLQHKQNLILFAAMQLASILEQMNNLSTQEAKCKRVQLASFFQILSGGSPIFKFESRANLYQFLQIINCPCVHLSHTSEWILSKHIYIYIYIYIYKIQQLAGEAHYMGATCDKSTIVDNTSWLCLQVYLMWNWARNPLLLILQKLDSNGYIAYVLLVVIKEILAYHSKMEPYEIGAKLIFFGANGVSSFHGCKNMVSKQLLGN